jgi:predicted glycosyltransferase
MRNTDMKKNVLFINSSIGLGHSARDLAIAREIKKETLI